MLVLGDMMSQVRSNVINRRAELADSFKERHQRIEERRLARSERRKQRKKDREQRRKARKQAH